MFLARGNSRRTLRSLRTTFTFAPSGNGPGFFPDAFLASNENGGCDPAGTGITQLAYAYSNPLAGRAKFIHTYTGDGNPLPSFEGEPKTLILPDVSIDELTDLIWTNLNEDNKVSLFVRYIDIATGETETRIVNKNV